MKLPDFYEFKFLIESLLNSLYPIQEQSPASQQNRTSRGSRGSFASQSSREWSLDSNDVFQPGQNNIDSDYGAEQKRKYYRSTSKGSKEGKTTHGSAASFGSSKGSMDDNTMISELHTFGNNFFSCNQKFQ